MGQMTTALYADFAVPVAVSAVSENANFPATNAAAVTSPNIPFKTGNNIALTERIRGFAEELDAAERAAAQRVDMTRPILLHRGERIADVTDERLRI